MRLEDYAKQKQRKFLKQRYFLKRNINVIFKYFVAKMRLVHFIFVFSFVLYLNFNF